MLYPRNKKRVTSSVVFTYTKVDLFFYFFLLFSNFLLSLDLSWKSHIFYPSLSFFSPTLYLFPKKNTSFSFQKTRSSFEKHLLPSFLQHVESLPKLSPSLFSHNLLSPLENQPRSLPKKFFFFYLIPNQIITQNVVDVLPKTM